jgi:hypothetical protein
MMRGREIEFDGMVTPNANLSALCFTKAKRETISVV